MSDGWNYPGGAIHDEFCDTAVGSGRGKEEEDGRDCKYDGLNRGDNQPERRRPDLSRWSLLNFVTIMTHFCLLYSSTVLAYRSNAFSSIEYLFQLPTAQKVYFRNGDHCYCQYQHNDTVVSRARGLLQRPGLE